MDYIIEFGRNEDGLLKSVHLHEFDGVKPKSTFWYYANSLLIDDKDMSDMDYVALRDNRYIDKPLMAIKIIK